jgi:arginase family enzyme
MTVHYRLLPTLDVASLGRSHYLFDRVAKTSPVVSVPTQRVPRRAHDVIRALKRANPADVPWTLDQLANALPDPKDRAALEVLARCGYLEQRRSATDAGDEDAQSSAAEVEQGSSEGSAANLKRTFDLLEAKHFFNRPSLFNVPADIDDAEVEVGFVGLPFASMADSVGTVGGPDGLRVLTRTQDFWFDVYRRGAVSDVGLAGSLPSILGKGVMLKDYGNVGGGVRTVADLFGATRELVDGVLVPHGIRPLLAGGDHAVTFPVVHALRRHYPDLCLVHLDAHHDLFYISHLVYSHSATVGNLLVYSDLARVYSFGLRTYYDDRVKNVERAMADESLRDRLHLYSIGAFKRMLADRVSFLELLAEIGPTTPCYLSIDLDVLSEREIGTRTSTPKGVGIDWWELLEAVRLLCANLDVVGSDVVEYIPYGMPGSGDAGANPTVLLLLLIDGMAARVKASRAAAALSDPRQESRP